MRRRDARSIEPQRLPVRPLAVLLLACLVALAPEAWAGPAPIAAEELATVRVAGTGGGDSNDDDADDDDSGDDTPPFSIADSASDLNTYVMDCMQLRDTFVEWRIEAYASTVANRSAHYLGVDVKLYTKGVLRKQKFNDSYGPISAISASVVYNAPCHEYEEASPEARGWHKGIDERGDEPVYRNTRDR